MSSKNIYIIAYINIVHISTLIKRPGLGDSVYWRNPLDGRESYQLFFQDEDTGDPFSATLGSGRGERNNMWGLRLF